MALAKIVYASMTGNTEEIADIVAKKLEELGHTVDVDECTTVDAADFEDADICIVATYTYGDGELPDEIVDFYEDLADLDLSGKIFGVVGSGDTFTIISVNQLMNLKHNSPLLVQLKVRIVSKLTFLLKMKISKTLKLSLKKFQKH